MRNQYSCEFFENGYVSFTRCDQFDVSSNVIHQQYFREFIRSLIKAEERHLFECQTSKLSYLLEDYRRIYYRSFPYQSKVEYNIRRLLKTIDGEFKPFSNPIKLVLKECNGVYSLSLTTGEQLWTSSETQFARLLLSPILD